jgi:hypothetical protein
MAKGELPYFKFKISDWNGGDILQCSLTAQGLFINLCALYWGKQGNLSYSKMLKKFPRKQKHFSELLDEGVLKLNEDKLVISFLDEQLSERGAVSVKNTNNAIERWNKGKSDATVFDSHNVRIDFVPYKEEKREEEKRKEKKIEEGAIALVVEDSRETKIPFGEGTLVRKAWDEWEQYRKEKKQTLTPSTIKKQIQFLAGRADPEIIAIIHASIHHGWTGLFDLNKKQRYGRAATKRTSDAIISGGEDFGTFG